MATALAGKSIGFLGAGAMASAMIQGLLRAGVSTESLCASDPFAGSRERLQQLGVHATESNADVAAKSDIIVVAVKPNVVETALRSAWSHLKREQLVVSIAAGVKIETIEAACPFPMRVVRTMPNVACLVGEAAVGMARNERATPDYARAAEALFAGGVCVEVAEKDLDAVTAVSGSGPAYVFLFVEALADAGVRAGLSRQVAVKLAAQTVKGAAAMQISTGTHPAVLKDQVCSPGGTTIAGVEALERNGFRFAAMSAVAAAAQRSAEMGTAAAAQK